MTFLPFARCLMHINSILPLARFNATRSFCTIQDPTLVLLGSASSLLPIHLISSLFFISETIMSTHTFTFCGDPISCHSDAWMDGDLLCWYTCWLAAAAADLDSLGFVMCKLQHHEDDARKELEIREWVGSEKEAFPHFIPMKTSVKLHWNGYYDFCWCWRCASGDGADAAGGSDGVTFAHFAFHFLGWRFLLVWVVGNRLAVFFPLLSVRYRMLSNGHTDSVHVWLPFPKSFFSERINTVIHIWMRFEFDWMV